MKNDIRIALVSSADPLDRRTWSGSTYFMASALERRVGLVDYIGPLLIPGQKLKEKLSTLTQKILGIRTYPTRTRKAATFFSREIAKKLSGSEYDVIFAPAASIEIAYLETELPIIYVSDATFSLMLDIYPIFSSLTKEAVDQENLFEKSAIDKATFIIYPSNWAARSAVDEYGADKEKVKVIPFGANLDTEPAAEIVSGKTIDGSVKILFLAKDWERKGGAIAFDTLIELLKMGISAELTVCGIIPPSGFEHPNMNVIPYLDKNVKADRKRFEQTLIDSHLLLLPTRIECYGIVFCEANAYGLPVFATRVGGVPTIVNDGENGYLLPTDATGKEFAEVISRTVVDKNKYTALNHGARDRYEKVLNWDSWGMEVRKLIEEFIGI